MNIRVGGANEEGGSDYGSRRWESGDSDRKSKAADDESADVCDGSK